jgi:hypothetical protein
MVQKQLADGNIRGSSSSSSATASAISSSSGGGGGTAAVAVAPTDFAAAYPRAVEVEDVAKLLDEALAAGTHVYDLVVVGGGSGGMAAVSDDNLRAGGGGVAE